MADTFILQQEMKTNLYSKKEIDVRIEIARQIQNTVLGKLMKCHEQMVRTKRHQKLYRQLSAVLKKLSKVENKKDEENKVLTKQLKKELNEIYDALYQIRLDFGLTKNDAEKYAKPVRYHFNEILDANTAQKAAERAWIAYEKYLTKQSKKVSFKNIGEVRSIEGKSNKQGIRFINHRVFLTKTLSLPIIQKPHDIYAMEVLNNIEEGITKVKYCRIIRKEIRGKERYFVQLILDGIAPSKRCSKTGRFKRVLGKGDVGIDIGTQSVAVVGEEKVLLTELSPQTNPLGRELSLIERKMERSKRAMNPNNYNQDGTIKKGTKKWVYSKRYKLLQKKRRELFRKQTVIRKQSHNYMTNIILSFGDRFYVETMNFKALQKRSSKTEKNQKGKFKRKKRFGKSIGNKAPSLFLNLLKQKVLVLGGHYQEINTQTFKASQYDHVKDEFIKKKLSQRWHEFDDGSKIQRDLYSAFLLMNSLKNGKVTDKEKCIERYTEFKILHDHLIESIKEQRIAIKNSGIRLVLS